jgi:hypothetical protein
VNILLSNPTITALLALWMVTACNSIEREAVVLSDPSFDLKGFNPLENYGIETDTIRDIDVDWSQALDGIEFPTTKHTPSGYFLFSFRIKNNSNAPRAFLYKIYYRNDSYSFPISNDTASGYSELLSENFYGSWDDTLAVLHKTPMIPGDGEFHLVTDSFRISGNPRFETKYFSEGINQKWQRNPRVGLYSFLLLVCTEQAVAESRIPLETVNLHRKRNGHYVDPFDELLLRLDRTTKGAALAIGQHKLRATARMDLTRGIYIDEGDFDADADKKFHCATCNSGEKLRKESCFKQFRPTIISDTYFENIPLIEDVTANSFDKDDYYWNKHFTTREERIRTIPMRPRAGCESVRYDASGHHIELRNPASKPYDWRKEISGVKTRHGFSYGKVRVKCKLSRMLNDKGMWNGLTNAIWLITQSQEEWNNLRPCRNGGYMAEYLGDENSERKEVTAYSEIDFEIMKAHPYCPMNEFPPFFRKSVPRKDRYDFWSPKASPELESDEGKVLVACTNWDMACQDPSKQAGGCVTLVHNDKNHSSFRWGKSSRATTGGELVSDKELFGRDHYYFEIDWKPTEIVWRIGPEPDQMRTVCYMDSSFTSIPNNQMLLIIDQEFHNTKWWFGAPFEQENIPFPAKELVGKIYEVTIE